MGKEHARAGQGPVGRGLSGVAGQDTVCGDELRDLALTDVAGTH